MSQFCIKLMVFLVLSLFVLDVGALEIKDVRADQKAFDPHEKESTDIHFEITESAAVELHIYDGRDLLIHRITKEFSAGEQTLSWDGRDAGGHVVPAEAYRYVLKGMTDSGDTQVYDLSDLTGGERLTIQSVEWDSEAETIRYRLPNAARVAVRIGLKDNGPLLRTLRDWVPRPSGVNEEHWDGWDESKVIELSSHPRLSIFVDAYALSDNTLLVGKSPDQIEFVSLAPSNRQERTSPQSGDKTMHYHPEQPLETRGDIDVTLALAKDYRKNDDGIPVVSGLVPVRFDVAPEHRKRAVNRRFETVFFVDGTFAYEMEVGYVPVTWQWDADSVNPGVHYLTVNFRGYEGNFGVATQKVYVEPQKAP